jgi:hypothetical protein
MDIEDIAAWLDGRRATRILWLAYASDRADRGRRWPPSASNVIQGLVVFLTVRGSRRVHDQRRTRTAIPVQHGSASAAIKGASEQAA